MYNNFDFNNNPQWIEFAKNIDQSISAERLNYIRQLWFKKFIDQSHNMKLETISEIQEQSKIPGYMYTMENIFKFSFMVLLFPHFGLFSNMLALIRQVKNQGKKIPQTVRNNEFFHNLLYLLMMSYFEKMNNHILFAPILIHSWVGICEFLFLNHPSIYQKIKTVVDKTRQNRDKLLIQKNKWEIYLFVFLIFVRFLDFGNWVLIILYLNFLKIKYHNNQRQREAWGQIDVLLQNNNIFYQYLRSAAIYIFTQ